MKNKIKKILNKARRKAKIRKRIIGTNDRPRLSIFRSNTNVYLQVIDDASGKTLVAADTREIKEKREGFNVETALGKLIAEKASTKKIDTVVFDRGGYKFHGKVKAVADGAREAGLKF